MLKQVSQVLGAGFEKLMFLILASVMVCHVSCCLWIFQSQMVDEGTTTWMDGDVAEMNAANQYLTSFYFMITTFSTVGYGDMSANNAYEKIFCILIMCIGVTAFAMGTSTLTNVLQTYNQEDKHLQEKIGMLDQIHKDYFLPLKLYENVKKSIKCQHSKDIED